MLELVENPDFSTVILDVAEYRLRLELVENPDFSTVLCTS